MKSANRAQNKKFFKIVRKVAKIAHFKVFNVTAKSRGDKNQKTRIIHRSN